MSWCNLTLSSWGGHQVLAAIPTPADLIERCRTLESSCPIQIWCALSWTRANRNAMQSHPTRDTVLNPENNKRWGLSPLTLGALALESIGEDQLALAWAVAVSLQNGACLCFVFRSREHR